MADNSRVHSVDSIKFIIGADCTVMFSYTDFCRISFYPVRKIYINIKRSLEVT
jgi:hypothetical protein